MDAATGAVLHTWNAVPNGCTGGPVSSSAAVDPATGTIYITTGASPNSCPSPYPIAMIALRASDLSLVGSWQIPATQPQSGDSDFLAAPTLFTANIGGTQRNMVGAVNKDGLYYAFDRSNISAGPVWTATVGAVGDCPTCGPPGAAIDPSAWDGKTLYVGGNSTTINGVACNGSVRALNPATGAFLWQDCLSSVAIGAVSVSNGVVAVGAGPYFYVLSAATGSTIFSYHDANPGPPPIGGTADFWAGPAIGQGVIYEGNIDGSLFALGL
jgi:polyvinyl alcohol dehydrogenase (cytochrome)